MGKGPLSVRETQLALRLDVCQEEDLMELDLEGFYDPGSGIISDAFCCVARLT